MASSKKGQGTPEEELMAAIFGEKPWDARFPLCYPYIIVIGENGEQKTLGLAQAIQDALNTLPLHKGRNDLQEWDADKQVLELRFGLRDGAPKTLERVGQEIGKRTRERVRTIQEKALRRLRHPSCSRRLREFFVPSPEEMAWNNEKLREQQEVLRRAGERIHRLLDILKGYGLREEDFEKVNPEDIPQTAQARREAREEQEALQALKKKFPNNRFWNALARAHVRGLSELKELVESGEIIRVRSIGAMGEEFFRQVLQAAEREAPS